VYAQNIAEMRKDDPLEVLIIRLLYTISIVDKCNEKYTTEVGFGDFRAVRAVGKRPTAEDVWQKITVTSSRWCSTRGRERAPQHREGIND
jgi:hypothetical protein